MGDETYEGLTLEGLIHKVSGKMLPIISKEWGYSMVDEVKYEALSLQDLTLYDRHTVASDFPQVIRKLAGETVHLRDRVALLEGKADGIISKLSEEWGYSMNDLERKEIIAKQAEGMRQIEDPLLGGAGQAGAATMIVMGRVEVATDTVQKLQARLTGLITTFQLIRVKLLGPDTTDRNRAIEEEKIAGNDQRGALDILIIQLEIMSDSIAEIEHYASEFHKL